MLNNAVDELLDKYIEGKDQNNFELLAEIYRPQAKVTFEVHRSAVYFPSEIRGNREIAQVFATDFSKHNEHVRTYYLSECSVNSADLTISGQQWFVLMREKSTQRLKVGVGYYDWGFELEHVDELKIKTHHITIGLMISLSDLSLDYLSSIQSCLPYPWTSAQDVVDVLKEREELKEVVAYLKNNS